MQSPEEDLSGKDVAVFIEPYGSFRGIRRVEGILGSLQGELRVCDPYIDNRTLDFLGECISADSIRLLTANVFKESKSRRDLKAFNAQHVYLLEVRVAVPSVLHDRYIAHSSGLLVIGTSLNSLGAKETFVISLGEDVRHSLIASFDRSWSRASCY